MSFPEAEFYPVSHWFQAYQWLPQVPELSIKSPSLEWLLLPPSTGLWLPHLQCGFLALAIVLLLECLSYFSSIPGLCLPALLLLKQSCPPDKLLHIPQVQLKDSLPGKVFTFSPHLVIVASGWGGCLLVDTQKMFVECMKKGTQPD